MIAGETSQAYNEVVTFNLVSLWIPQDQGRPHLVSMWVPQDQCRPHLVRV